MKLIATLALSLLAGSALAAPWNAGMAYTKGQVVQWQGRSWQAKWPSRGETPGANPKGSWIAHVGGALRKLDDAAPVIPPCSRRCSMKPI